MNGFFIIDKEEGWTSFDAVAKLRRITGVKKIGHTGTLDPMATGVLPIMLGRATKLIQYLPSGDKRYTAKMKLGARTDTLDRTGAVTAVSDKRVGIEQITPALAAFTGGIEQVPPMYSAVKKDGVRLYELARRGRCVEREKRRVTVHGIDIIGYDADVCELTLDIRCSGGTYIRTLADDLGVLLGTYAHLTALRRTEACGFTEEMSVKLSDIDLSCPFDKMAAADAAFAAYAAVRVSPAQSARLINGGGVNVDRVGTERDISGRYVRIYDGRGFAGIGEVRGDEGVIKPACMLRTSADGGS